MKKHTYTVARFEGLSTAEETQVGEVMYMRGEGQVTSKNPFNVFTGNYLSRDNLDIYTKQNFPAYEDAEAEIASDWMLWGDNDGYWRWYEGVGDANFVGFGTKSYNHINAVYTDSPADLDPYNDLRYSPICWDELTKFEKAVAGVDMVNSIKLDIFNENPEIDFENERYAYRFDKASFLEMNNVFNPLRSADFFIREYQTLKATLMGWEDKPLSSGTQQSITYGNDQSITMNTGVSLDGESGDFVEWEAYITEYPPVKTYLWGNAGDDEYIALNPNGTITFSATESESYNASVGVQTSNTPIALNTWTTIRVGRYIDPNGINSVHAIAFDDTTVSSSYGGDYNIALTITTVVAPNIYTGLIRNVKIGQIVNFERVVLAEFPLNEALATEPAEDIVGGKLAPRVGFVQADMIPSPPEPAVPSIRTLFDASPITESGVEDDDTKRLHLAIDVDNSLMSETTGIIKEIRFDGDIVELGDILPTPLEGVKHYIEIDVEETALVTFIGTHRDKTNKYTGFIFDVSTNTVCDVAYIYPMDGYGLLNQYPIPNKSNTFKFNGATYKRNNWQLINKEL